MFYPLHVLTRISIRIWYGRALKQRTLLFKSRLDLLQVRSNIVSGVCDSTIPPPGGKAVNPRARLAAEK